MAKTPGERAEQDANAAKGRSLDCNLAPLVYGGVRDRSRTTRNMRKINRLHNFETDAAAHTDFHLIDKDIHGNPWKSVDSVMFAGILLNEEQYEAIQRRLEALYQQVALIVDFHEDRQYSLPFAEHFPAARLGQLGAPLGDLPENARSLAHPYPSDDA